jgi:ATP-binding cassette subfamily B protein
MAKATPSAHPPGRLTPRLSPPPPPGAESATMRGFFGVFRYSRRALELVWSTSRNLTLALGVLTVIAGVIPAGVAKVGALIVDAVVAAARAGGEDPTLVIELVLLEGVLIAVMAAAQRGISLCQSLLRAQLGQRVNVMILEKALTLELRHFEDSEF